MTTLPPPSITGASTSSSSSGTTLGSGEGGETLQDTTVPPLPADLQSRTVILPATASGQGSGAPTAATYGYFPAAPATASQPLYGELAHLVSIYNLLQQLGAQRPDANGMYKLPEGFQSVDQGTMLRLFGQSQMGTDTSAAQGQFRNGQVSEAVLPHFKLAVDKALTQTFDRLGVNVTPNADGTLPQTAVTKALGSSVPPSVRDALQQQGYTLGGSKLTDVMQSVQQGGQTTSGGGLKEGQLDLPSVDQSGTQTALQAYNAFVTNYKGATAAEQGQIVSQLVDILGTDHPSETEVFQAYQQILSSAVAQDRSPQAIIAALPGPSSQQGLIEQQGEIGSYVRAQAADYGVQLTPDQENQIIATAQAQNWTTYDNSDQIQRLIASNFSFPQNGTPGGYAGVINNTISNIAGSYMIPLSQQAKEQYVTSMIKSGAGLTNSYDATNMAESQFTEQAKQIAAGLFPSLADGINRGLTTQTLFDPYQQVAQDLLGVDGATVSPTIPKWSAPLDARNPQTGAPQTMTLDQWKKTLMSDPQYGFQHTQAGMDMASSLANALGETFGKTAAPGNFSYNSSVPQAAYGA